MSWYLNYIDIILTPFGPLYGATWGPKVPKTGKMAKKGAHFYETILGGKYSKLIVLSNSESSFCQYFLVTEKTEKFLQILILEILKLDFQIPGKILSEILVQHSLGC